MNDDLRRFRRVRDRSLPLPAGPGRLWGRVMRLLGRRRMSQGELWERAGLSRGCLPRVRREETAPRLRTLKALARVFDIPASWFVYDMYGRELRTWPDNWCDNLSGNIDQLSKTRGLSKKALCKKAGISRACLRKIQLGSSEPRFVTLEGFAYALGVPVSRLFEPVAHTQLPLIRRVRATSNFELSLLAARMLGELDRTSEDFLEVVTPARRLQVERRSQMVIDDFFTHASADLEACGAIPLTDTLLEAAQPVWSVRHYPPQLKRASQ